MTASTPSSRDVEREADDQRAELSSTLDQLRDKLTPGQIVDDMMAGSSVQASKFLSNLGTTVSNHPVPSLLIGAGIAMLVTGKTGIPSFGRSRGRRYSGDLHDDAHGYDRFDENRYAARYAGRSDASGTSGGVGAAVGGMARSAADAVSSGLGAVRGVASSAAEAASGLAGQASDMASDLASGVSGTVGDGMSGMADRASRFTSRAGVRSRAMMGDAERLTHYLSEQPLVLAALGAALGAAIGAALPRTRMEDDAIGETSDRFKESAQEMAKAQYENAKEAAGHAFQEVRTQVEAEGFSVEGAKAAAGDLGDKLASLADKATATIKKEAEGLAKGATSQG